MDLKLVIVDLYNLLVLYRSVHCDLEYKLLLDQHAMAIYSRTPHASSLPVWTPSGAKMATNADLCACTCIRMTRVHLLAKMI